MLDTPPKPPPPKKFIADHPFIYALVTENADVLFAGTFGERSAFRRHAYVEKRK